MTFSRSCFEYNSTNSYSSVSWDAWMNTQRLPCVSNKCSLWDLLLNLWYWLEELCLLGDLNKCAEASICPWTPATRPSSKLTYHTDLNSAWAKPSPDSPMTDLFKTIFQALICRAPSPRTPEQKCRGFPVSVVNALYKTTFWLGPSYWINELCLQWHLNNERKEASSVSPIQGLFKTTLSLELWYQTKALSPERLAQSSVSQEAWNEHAEMRLPQCQWCRAFSRPLYHQSYHISSKLSPPKT